MQGPFFAEGTEKEGRGSGSKEEKRQHKKNPPGTGKHTVRGRSRVAGGDRARHHDEKTGGMKRREEDSRPVNEDQAKGSASYRCGQDKDSRDNQAKRKKGRGRRGKPHAEKKREEWKQDRKEKRWEARSKKRSEDDKGKGRPNEKADERATRRYTQKDEKQEKRPSRPVFEGSDKTMRVKRKEEEDDKARTEEKARTERTDKRRADAPWHADKRRRPSTVFSDSARKGSSGSGKNAPWATANKKAKMQQTEQVRLEPQYQRAVLRAKPSEPTGDSKVTVPTPPKPPPKAMPGNAEVPARRTPVPPQDPPPPPPRPALPARWPQEDQMQEMVTQVVRRELAARASAGQAGSWESRPAAPPPTVEDMVRAALANPTIQAEARMRSANAPIPAPPPPRTAYSAYSDRPWK